MGHGSLNVIGARVRQLRDQVGISQSVLAARCQVAGLDISRVALALIEGGKRGVSDHEVHLLAAALRVPIAELFPKKPQLIHRKQRNPAGPPLGKRTKRKKQVTRTTRSQKTPKTA